MNKICSVFKTIIHFKFNGYFMFKSLISMPYRIWIKHCYITCNLLFVFLINLNLILSLDFVL